MYFFMQTSIVIRYSAHVAVLRESGDILWPRRLSLQCVLETDRSDALEIEVDICADPAFNDTEYESSSGNITVLNHHFDMIRWVLGVETCTEMPALLWYACVLAR